MRSVACRVGAQVFGGSSDRWPSSAATTAATMTTPRRGDDQASANTDRAQSSHQVAGAAFEVVEKGAAGSLVDVIAAHRDDDHAGGDECDGAGAGLHQACADPGILCTGGLPGAPGEPERGVREREIDDRQREGLRPIQHFRGRALGFRVGRTTQGRFDEPPQRHHQECDRGDPERGDAARFGGYCRERPGLVGAAGAAAQRDPDGEVADGQVQQAAHDISGAGESFEDAVLRDLCHGGGRGVVRHLRSLLTGRRNRQGRCCCARCRR